MTPLLLTALAVALPSRIGLINVGGEGQLYMGACLATWAALTFAELPGWLLLPIMALSGMLGGAAWAWIPGQLRALGLVNETISTLLLNPSRCLDRVVLHLRLLAFTDGHEQDPDLRRSRPACPGSSTRASMWA